MAFTYNDPVIFLEYAVDVAQACHELGIKTVAATAGYICEEPSRDFYSSLDSVNIDLKSFNKLSYSQICAGLQPQVLDTLAYLKQETQVWFEITNLLILSEMTMSLSWKE